MHNTVDADLLKKDLEAKLQRLVQEDLRIVPAWELADYADGWGKQMSPKKGSLLLNPKLPIFNSADKYIYCIH